MSSGYCSTCRKGTGKFHGSTDAHRKAVARAEHIPDLVAVDMATDRARIMRAFRPNNGTARQNEEAMRRLNHEPPAWADEAPPPEPWEDPDYRPDAPTLAIVPSARPTCPRCGQSFRRSGNGHAWHVANRPDCAKRHSIVS